MTHGGSPPQQRGSFGKKKPIEKKSKEKALQAALKKKGWLPAGLTTAKGR